MGSSSFGIISFEIWNEAAEYETVVKPFISIMVFKMFGYIGFSYLIAFIIVNQSEIAAQLEVQVGMPPVDSGEDVMDCFEKEGAPEERVYQGQPIITQHGQDLPVESCAKYCKSNVVCDGFYYAHENEVETFLPECYLHLRESKHKEVTLIQANIGNLEFYERKCGVPSE